VNTLRFIKRSRDLGFSMAEIAELVNLWQDRSRASASVKHIAQKHLDELGTRIAAMQAMQRSLQDLLQHCHGCPRTGLRPCGAAPPKKPSASSR
jgi:MerR family copper efflux transcriptional regulator